MIEWKCVAEGADGLRIYRVDAESGNVSMGGGSGRAGPLDLVFQQYPTKTTRYLSEKFQAGGSPVGGSSFSVACHVVSLPDLIFVVDSTYRTTAGEIFPGTLDEIAASEGRRLTDRPIQVLYTHAHFDHAGGHQAVEAMSGDVEILTHPYTAQLFPIVSQRESFFRIKETFFRDCEICVSISSVTDEIRATYARIVESTGADMSQAPWGSVDDEPMRVDLVPLADEASELLCGNGRLEILRFDGHIPGHLCVCVDGAHFITGDMWLPATTSLVTPSFVGPFAEVPEDCFGVLRYIESDLRLLDMPVDDCMAYPSHEVIYRNPKRMAMRDLEILTSRIDLLYEVLEEHQRKPMRVLDLAWGGRSHRPLWKVEGSVFRLVVAHDEAASFVRDLVEFEDLREVEPERYVWTGQSDFRDRVTSHLHEQRQAHGHLEFVSRGAIN